jgi:ATP-dependent Clp protease protease subunit
MTVRFENQPKMNFGGTKSASLGRVQNSRPVQTDRFDHASLFNMPSRVSALKLKGTILGGIQAAQVRFAGTLNEDYNVELRVGEPVNQETTSMMLRSLLLRHLVKKENKDTSTLKLFLDGSFTNWFMGTSRAALADVLALVDRPVDVIVKENVSTEGVMALQSATGKRLMFEHAYISLGPVNGGAPYMRNDDHAVRREFQNEYTRDLENLIMEKTGFSDRNKLYYEELNRAYPKNSLQALYFGEKGLVDGVLVGHDQVVTRDTLNAYLAENDLTGEKRTQFLNETGNIRKIPSIALSVFSPQSIPNGSPVGKLKEVNVYQDPASLDLKTEAEKQKKEKDKAEQDKAKAAYEEAKEKYAWQLSRVSGKARQKLLKKLEALKPKPLTLEATAANSASTSTSVSSGTPAATAPGLTVFVDTPESAAAKMPLEKIALKLRVKEANVKQARFNMANVPGERSFLEDDVIFFNDGFVDESAEQMTDALTALDVKKRQEADSSHVKILVNSPGGSIWSGMDIRSTINQMKSKVDVIVTGMAASCGAYLMSSATGVRMATPNARIMIHDAWWSLGAQTDLHYNDRIDYLDRSTRNFVEAIADASGRPFEAVWEDMKIDVWLNPLESMFYGDKGLTDVVLLEGNKAITKADVKAYMLEQMGSEAAFNSYVENKITSLRSGKRSWKPEDHNENDPFGNPLRTIQLVAKRFAKPVSEIPILQKSTPRPNTPLNHYVMSLKKAKGTGGSVDGQSSQGEEQQGMMMPLSKQSQSILKALQARWAPNPTPD